MNQQTLEPHAHEAMFYEKLADGKVRCNLCEFRCEIPAGKVGACWVRENRGGSLYTNVYGLAIALHVDPIEKKPLFHMRPGSRILSVATVGCNFRCSFCQNWQISQKPKGRGTGEITGETLMPEALVDMAVKQGCRNMAYTYSEPTIFFEYAYDACKAATARGVYNVFVSNGYITPEAARAIQPYLQAINIDLKGFDDKRYRQVMGGRLQPVCDAIRFMHDMGVWVEVTTLVIPGVNDSEKELRDIAKFIKSVGPEIPWHISRFHADYKMLDTPPTPVATLARAQEIGKEEGLFYVYVGNVPGNGGEHTYCSSCNELLIKRVGFQVAEYRLVDEACPKCSTKLHGVDLALDPHHQSERFRYFM